MNLDAMKFSAAVDVQQAAQAIAHRRKELLTGQSIVPFKVYDVYDQTPYRPWLGETRNRHRITVIFEMRNVKLAKLTDCFDTFIQSISCV